VWKVEPCLAAVHWYQGGSNAAAKHATASAAAIVAAAAVARTAELGTAAAPCQQAGL